MSRQLLSDYSRMDIASGMKNGIESPFAVTTKVKTKKNDLSRKLNFVEGSNVHTLNKVFDFLNLFSQPINGDFVIFHDTGDLEFVDAIGERYQLC